MLLMPMLKKLVAFLAKGLLLYLALIFLWIDLVLFETASPRFEQAPFVQPAALILAISAVISLGVRSKTPLIFTVFCVAYSAFYFVFPHQATSFIALFCVLAGVNFLYRNKVTEPLLVMLPVIAGAWVLIGFVYPSYLVGWANYVSGQKDFAGSILEGLSAAKEQLVSTLMLIPVGVMYFLGKHAYVKLYSVLKSLHKRKAT